MNLVEFTVASDRSRLSVNASMVVEVRDFSKQPNRHLEKWGRTRLTTQGRRRIHTFILEDYDLVMAKLAAAGAAPAVAGPTLAEVQQHGESEYE